MGRKLKFVLIPIVIVSAALGFRYYNQYRFHLEKQTRFMMDTIVSIYVIGPQKVASRAMRAAFDRMQEVDAKFSAHNPQGIIAAFNNQGTPISDPEILGVVKVALDVARETDGAFDITVEPLLELWGFYSDSPKLPAPEEIAATLDLVGYQKLTLENGKLEKINPGVRIDLGGIAKGYAISQAAAVLKEQGISSALIDAGGDVYGLGKRGGDLWKVGIRSPRAENLLGYLEVEDLTVMGSGDYHRFFMKDGRRYHHIFNPATGYPAEGLTGTTLIHPDPTLADAWCTAVFVLGPEKGMALVEKKTGMEAVMVTSSDKILYSSGLKDALHFNSNLQLNN